MEDSLSRAGLPAGAVDQSIIDRLALLESSVTEIANIEPFGFDFVTDGGLRDVLRQDYEEAQRAFSAGAFKAAAMIAAAVVEGILLEGLRRPTTATSNAWPAAVKHLQVGKDGVVDWDRASLLPLVRAAVAVGLVPDTFRKLTEGVADYRDAVHPNAELRLGIRAGRDDAIAMLAVARMAAAHVQTVGTVQQA